MAQFFEAIYISIFKRFLVAEFTGAVLLRPILTYYKTVETNGQEKLYLHFLI